MGDCLGIVPMSFGMFLWVLVFIGFGYLPEPWNEWCRWGWYGVSGIVILGIIAISIKLAYDSFMGDLRISGRKYENFTYCDTYKEAEQCVSYIRDKGHEAEFVSEDWEGKRQFRVYVRYIKGKPQVSPYHYYEHFGIDRFKDIKESEHVIKRNARKDAMTADDIQKLIKVFEGDLCIHCGADHRPTWWGGRRYKPLSSGGCFPVGHCCCERFDDWIIFIDLVNDGKIIESQLSSNRWNKDALKILFMRT
jgi:hypothetical protein